MYSVFGLALARTRYGLDFHSNELAGRSSIGTISRASCFHLRPGMSRVGMRSAASDEPSVRFSSGKAASCARARASTAASQESGSSEQNTRSK